MTLVHIKTLSDALAADNNYWKHCDKSKNYSKQVTSSFATIFSTPFNKYIIIYRDFLYYCLDVFKDVCCYLVVCGKGLIISSYAIIHQLSFENLWGDRFSIRKYWNLILIYIELKKVKIVLPINGWLAICCRILQSLLYQGKCQI